MNALGLARTTIILASASLMPTALYAHPHTHLAWVIIPSAPMVLLLAPRLLARHSDSDLRADRCARACSAARDNCFPLASQMQTVLHANPNTQPLGFNPFSDCSLNHSDSLLEHLTMICDIPVTALLHKYSTCADVLAVGSIVFFENWN